MKTRIVWLAVLIVLTLSALGLPVLAQETDAEGCKDHPMFTRMKSYFLQGCELKDFDEVEFFLAAWETKTLEGKKTKIDYAVKEGAQMASPLQIRRNYGNAVKALGGTILLDEGNTMTGRIVKSGREVWVSAVVYNDGALFTLTVLAVGEMVQEVSANDMLEALNKDGYIALYINFDSGKADLKPESEGMISQIVALLTGNADLKVGIEGHTDNVGTPAANKALSEQRAKAVMAAVVKGGVSAARLTAFGWGQEKPIADNRGEEGRAKNRRVEIVKK
ncbi:MAG: OmpA family protein [Candidatus Aminicenantes bacterium]|nr:OmpA family protein [Candidatus Aminicenantes bacterium]